MEFLVYRSHALIGPRSPAADEVLSASMSNNAQDDLTGFLHHESDFFLQYIEGPADPLRRLWNRIASDRRHRAATVIGSGLVSNRFFEGWSLGYSTRDVACFLDFLQDAAGKTLVADADARESLWFLRGACQRVDLGLVRQIG